MIVYDNLRHHPADDRVRVVRDVDRAFGIASNPVFSGWRLRTLKQTWTTEAPPLNTDGTLDDLDILALGLVSRRMAAVVHRARILVLRGVRYGSTLALLEYAHGLVATGRCTRISVGHYSNNVSRTTLERRMQITIGWDSVLSDNDDDDYDGDDGNNSKAVTPISWTIEGVPMVAIDADSDDPVMFAPALHNTASADGSVESRVRRDPSMGSEEPVGMEGAKDDAPSMIVYRGRLRNHPALAHRVCKAIRADMHQQWDMPSASYRLCMRVEQRPHAIGDPWYVPLVRLLGSCRPWSRTGSRAAYRRTDCLYTLRFDDVHAAWWAARRRTMHAAGETAHRREQSVRWRGRHVDSAPSRAGPNRERPPTFRDRLYLLDSYLAGSGSTDVDYAPGDARVPRRTDHAVPTTTRSELWYIARMGASMGLAWIGRHVRGIRHETVATVECNGETSLSADARHVMHILVFLAVYVLVALVSLLYVALVVRHHTYDERIVCEWLPRVLSPGS